MNFHEKETWRAVTPIIPSLGPLMNSTSYAVLLNVGDLRGSVAGPFHFTWSTFSPMGCYLLTWLHFYASAGNSLRAGLLSEIHTCTPSCLWRGPLTIPQTPASLPAPKEVLHLL